MPILDRGLWSQRASDPCAVSGQGGAEVVTDLVPRPVPFSAVTIQTSPRDHRPRTESEALTADLSRVHVTVPREFFALLEAARSALSHAMPGASDGDILVEGLKAIVDRCAKRRGIVKKPRKQAVQVGAPAPTPGATREARVALDHAPTPDPASHSSRRREHVPAHVRRAVWERDGGRCSFPLEGGGVCGSTHQLELDHVTPVALGGTSTVDDLRVACRVHNLDAARRVFGDAYVDACIRRRRAGGSGGARVAASGQAET